MLKNIVKITLIILMIAPISATTISQQATHLSLKSDAAVMILAKGQYIYDSRNFKPATDYCCIC